MRILWLVAALLGAPQGAQGQVSIVGPPPSGIATEYRQMWDDDGTGMTGFAQSFTADRHFLLGVTFWWIPGSWDPERASYETYVRVSEGLGHHANISGLGTLRTVRLSNHVVGQYNLRFSDAVALSSESTYSLTFRSRFCSYEELCVGAQGTGQRQPRLQFATADWYDRGYARDNYLDPATIPVDWITVRELPGDLMMALYFSDAPDADVVFVPESSTSNLLAIGLLGGVWLVARRRRASRA